MKKTKAITKIHNGTTVTWNERRQEWGIWRTWRRIPGTQRILFASAYGLKAWFIPVDDLDRGA